MYASELVTKIQEEIETLLRLINIEAAVVADDTSYLGLRFNIQVYEARFLIGERGTNLASFEYLIKRIVQKKYPDAPPFSLDVNDYKLRRVEGLRDEVKAIAKKVRMYRKEIMLHPMSSFERRVIHTALAEYPDITTESVGADANRRVVIKPYP